MNFTAVETSILNRIQRDFPLTLDPFKDMADQIGITERDFITSLKRLKSAGIVRNISGIFNASRLGFVSCLVAFIVEEGNIEKAAAMINAHPGVSHNYLRDHRYNIWFTIAAASERTLADTVQILAEKCGAIDHIILRNEKLIKIGLNLPVGDSNETADAAILTSDDSEETTATKAPVSDFSGQEKESIRLLQLDLPVEKDSFDALVKSAGSFIDAGTLIINMGNFKNKKILRRYSGVLRHRESGYRSNAMTVWKPGDGADMRFIENIFAVESSISHLYLRTVYPGRWEYPLFAMIHARTDKELDGIIDRLAHVSGITDFKSLRTLKEFKKERVVYFSQKFDDWERQAGV